MANKGAWSSTSPLALKIVPCLCVIIVATFVVPSNADCSDVSVRCRIPTANWGGQVTENGCSVGGEVSGSVTEGVVTGTVKINGNCYYKVTESDNAVYAYVGSITIGQCWGTFQWWCTPEHCGGTPSEKCNERIADCTVYRNGGCDSWYKVVEGDSCWAVANNNGLSLEGLLGLNPNYNCDNIQPNDDLCLHIGQGPATSVCEGHLI